MTMWHVTAGLCLNLLLAGGGGGPQDIRTPDMLAKFKGAANSAARQ